MLPLPSSLQVSPASTPKNVPHHTPPLSRQSREGSCDTGTGQSNARCLLQGKERHAQRRNTRKGQGSSGFLCLLQEQRGTTMPGWVRPDLGGPLQGKGHQGWPPGAPGESEAASSQHWGKRIESVVTWTGKEPAPGRASQRLEVVPNLPVEITHWRDHISHQPGSAPTPTSPTAPPHHFSKTQGNHKQAMSIRQAPWGMGMRCKRPSHCRAVPLITSTLLPLAAAGPHGGDESRRKAVPALLAQQRAAPQPQDIHAQRSFGEAGMG